MADIQRLAAAAAVFAIAAAARVAVADSDTAALPPFGANHTVGGAAGWFFDGAANASAANYSAWAANQSFYLGDYLIFNTNTYSTVVQTTNATAYSLCGGGYGGGGSKLAVEARFLAVLLDSEGANYFFSDAGGGAQCLRGMRLDIAVARGRGLPPVPPSYYAPLAAAAAARRRREGAGFLGVAFGMAVAVSVL